MADDGPAGFWIRAWALVVDFALFFLVRVSLGALAGALGGPEVADSVALLPAVWIFTLIFAGLYTSVLHAMCGQTLGKMAARVRLVGLDGELPGVGTALLRYAGYFASLAPMGFGYLMAALRPDKRALHDLLAGTRVERVARPAPPPLSPPEVAADPVAAADAPAGSGAP